MQLSMNSQVQHVLVFQDETEIGDKFWRQNNERLAEVHCGLSRYSRTDRWVKQSCLLRVHTLPVNKARGVANSVLKVVVEMKRGGDRNLRETGLRLFLGRIVGGIRLHAYMKKWLELPLGSYGGIEPVPLSPECLRICTLNYSSLL
jgi:hypothetical protein